MAIYAFPEFEGLKVKRIYASARYPSKRSGNTFFDSENKIKISDSMPKEVKGFFRLSIF